MTHDDVQRWLDAYVEAWRTYDAETIGALFAPDATYRYHAYDEPLTGRDAIVANWVDDPDAAGSWSARYEPYAVDGDRAVAIGESRYFEPDGSLRTIFYNLWTLRFDDEGQCLDFVEYYNELPERLRGTIGAE
jgi:ketosteroid isomerase-like protein